MIEAVNLTKGFQNQVVVRGLNLRVAPGEIVGLLGAAGSGKSTAIDLFLNLLKPTSGVSKLGGFDATLQPVETKKRVGYVPAGMPLYEQLTGAENVRYLGSLAGFDDLSEETIRDLFRELGLDAARAAERAGGYDADPGGAWSGIGAEREGVFAGRSDAGTRRGGSAGVSESGAAVGERFD